MLYFPLRSVALVVVEDATQYLATTGKSDASFYQLDQAVSCLNFGLHEYFESTGKTSALILMVFHLRGLEDEGTLSSRIKNESGDVPDSFCL
jgi:hypothetical protein